MVQDPKKASNSILIVIKKAENRKSKEVLTWDKVVVMQSGKTFVMGPRRRKQGSSTFL